MEDYDTFFESVKQTFDDFSKRMNEDQMIWIPADSSSYALYSLVQDKNRIVDKLSPISMLKAVKNPTEIQGMKDAQVCIYDYYYVTFFIV